MLEVPTLAIPYPDRLCILDKDSRDVAYGSVLSRKAKADAFIDPGGMKAELALGVWLVTYRNKCPAPGIEPGHSRPSQY